MEVLIPESHLHSQAGVAMYESIMESILRQCYVPGSSRYDTGILGAASASICVLTFSHILDKEIEGGSKQPDKSIGFPDLENQCFCVGETGYSDARTLTEARIQSWISNSSGWG